MPFFSVIIPTYNRSDLLREALQSVSNQEYADYEAIVVDDGSMEDIAAVVREFGSRFRYLHQENRGPGAARNLGIANATGEYIAFLDSDDLWFAWTLAIFRDSIARFNLPSFIAGTAISTEKPDDVPRIPAQTIDARCFPDYLTTASIGVWIGTCGAVIRRTLLREEHAFVPERMNAEDSDLWLRLGTAPGFVHIMQPPVFIYRRHVGSAVSNYRHNLCGIRYLIDREAIGIYPGASCRRRERRRILGRHVRPVALEALRRRMWRDAWGLYWRTFGWHISEGRLRFLMAFPMMAFCYMFISAIRKLIPSQQCY